MPLSAGDKLGPYEILAPIGAGGMGEVWKARDTKLDREVAIKVLPAALAQDPERLARFEREAKVLASLNHPNIAQIYGIEESNRGRALVMELVPGQTLQTPLPQAEALRIAVQIAEALEAAHEKGIIHRDLKPANIMITPTSGVKVLDFGLAAVPSRDHGSDATNSPTLTMQATQAGMIMGTAGYMSPEQAAGQTVDKRSDIWSFGVVLWEMLVGQRMFTGSTVAHILADVLRAPIDLEKLPKETPRAVRDLLKRCLNRDLKMRLQSIGDARVALQEYLADPGSGANSLPYMDSQHSLKQSKVAWGVAAVAVLAVAGLVAWTFYPRLAPRPPDAVRVSLDPPPDYALTGSRASGPQFAVSPDGRYVAFVADGGPNSITTRTIWIRALSALSPQKLDKTEGAEFPFWSPDSKNIAFFADDKLKRIAVTGGSPVNICDVTAGDGGAWFQPEGSSDSSSQGLILFAPAPGSIQRVPASGGVPTPVTKLAPGEAAHIYPQFLPDGKRFLYFVLGGAKPGIYVQTLGSEQRTFLLETPGRAVYAPPDLLLFLRDNTLLAQHWDWGALKPLGEPVSVADEVRSNPPTGRNAFSTSSTGVLAYRGDVRSEVVFTWYTRDGKSDGPGWVDTAFYQHVELSPDNKRAVVERRTTNGVSDMGLEMVELAGSGVSRLTSDPGTQNHPVWSPDSRRIAFVKRGRDGKAAVYQTLLGSGKDALVYPDIVDLNAWTRDGLVAMHRNGDATTVILLRAPEENATQPITEKPRTLLEAKYYVDEIRVSPDGTRAAYTSLETGSPEIWVAAFPSFTDRRKVGAGNQPSWRGDGRELVFPTPSGADFMAAEVKPGTAFEVGLPKQIFHATRHARIIAGHDYAMTTDGKRFLIRETPDTAQEIEPLYLILNWPSLLGK
jgi:serine/threonine protein kinase/Tol biopolymer transport system component